MTSTLIQTITTGQTGDLYADFASGWTYRHNGTNIVWTGGENIAPKGELTLILRDGQPAVDYVMVARFPQVTAKDIDMSVRLCRILHKRYI